MEKPNINNLKFYLARAEGVSKWDDNYQSYGVGLTKKVAKKEALSTLSRGFDEHIIEVWKYLDGEWYKQDNSS